MKTKVMEVELKRSLNPFLLELLHKFWNRTSDACPLEASEQERQENEWERWINGDI